MNKKSLLFHTISEKSINQITQKHFSADTEKFKLLKGGLFNTTYLIELKNSKRYILQIGPARSDILLPMERHLFEAELQICKLLQEKRIPANNPISSDFTKEIMDRDYIIFEYIDGIVLSDKTIREENKAELYRQAGTITKQMHNITGKYYGRVSNAYRGITFTKWSDYLFSEIQELRTACIAHRVYSASFFDKIENLFQKGAPYFEPIKEPHLVHGDLWAGNIMVSNNQKEILAFIDTDRCIFGDPDMDLAAPWMITDDFLQGYGNICETKSREAKLLYYRLLYAITDAYVWKVEYRNSLEYISTRRTIQKLIRKIEKQVL